MDRNIKRGVTALSAQYSSSRRVRTREASCDRQAKRALRLPVSAHLRWLYVRREGLDLGAVQTAATMFLIGLVHTGAIGGEGWKGQDAGVLRSVLKSAPPRLR